MAQIPRQSSRTTTATPNPTAIRLEPYPAPSFAAPPDWADGTAAHPPAPANPAHPGNGAGNGNAAAPDASRRANPDADANPDANPAGAAELEGVYIISVAARLLEMHPQTLRKYERLGLIQPGRTIGMLRLYSHEDLRRVMLIRHLMDNLGLNLAGVEFALNLVNNLNVFTRRLARATGDAELSAQIRDEVGLLCRSLSLPAPD